MLPLSLPSLGGVLPFVGSLAPPRPAQQPRTVMAGRVAGDAVLTPLLSAHLGETPPARNAPSPLLSFAGMLARG